jgi:hypothetical protein
VFKKGGERMEGKLRKSDGLGEFSHAYLHMHVSKYHNETP